VNTPARNLTSPSFFVELCMLCLSQFILHTAQIEMSKHTSRFIGRSFKQSGFRANDKSKSDQSYFQYEGWSDRIISCHTFEDIQTYAFPILRLLGCRIYHDMPLYSRLCRIGNAALRQVSLKLTPGLSPDYECSLITRILVTQRPFGTQSCDRISFQQ
jgi:THO complex subunit 2 N-terminus